MDDAAQDDEEDQDTAGHLLLPLLANLYNQIVVDLFYNHTVIPHTIFS